MQVRGNQGRYDGNCEDLPQQKRIFGFHPYKYIPR